MSDVLTISWLILTSRSTNMPGVSSWASSHLLCMLALPQVGLLRAGYGEVWRTGVAWCSQGIVVNGDLDMIHRENTEASTIRSLPSQEHPKRRCVNFCNGPRCAPQVC